MAFFPDIASSRMFITNSLCLIICPFHEWRLLFKIFKSDLFSFALWKTSSFVTLSVQDSLLKKPPALVRTLRNITQYNPHSHAAALTFLLILSTLPSFLFPLRISNKIVQALVNSPIHTTS